MSRDVVNDAWTAAPEMRRDFDYAAQVFHKRMQERSRAKLELEPPKAWRRGPAAPTLTPTGVLQVTSEEREQRRLEIKRQLLVAREFHAQARDGFGR